MHSPYPPPSQPSLSQILGYPTSSQARDSGIHRVRDQLTGLRPPPPPPFAAQTAFEPSQHQVPADPALQGPGLTDPPLRDPVWTQQTRPPYSQAAQAAYPRKPPPGTVIYASSETDSDSETTDTENADPLPTSSVSFKPSCAQCYLITSALGSNPHLLITSALGALGSNPHLARIHPLTRQDAAYTTNKAHRKLCRPSYGASAKSARLALKGSTGGYLQYFHYLGLSTTPPARRRVPNSGRRPTSSGPAPPIASPSTSPSDSTAREWWQCRLCHADLHIVRGQISNLGTHLYGTKRTVRSGCLEARANHPAEPIPPILRDESGGIVRLRPDAPLPAKNRLRRDPHLQ
ncbi:hypothetical protein OC834_004588 [Tilletia horrida]|nr:hypothetical protein OC834_004588 [Tilletia horrida]